MAVRTKIEKAFNDAEFRAFCDALLALPAKQRTYEGVAEFFRSKTGEYASHNAGKAFLKGPFARYVERLNSARETRDALVSAAGAGTHPLDAIEEAMVIELQDHLVQAEGGQLDIKFVVDQLTKLRMSISMRDESKRKEQDLQRKLRESETKIEAAQTRIDLIEQTIKLREFDAVTAAIKHAKEIRAVVGDKGIGEKEKTERVRKILFGDRPANWQPVKTTGAQAE